MVNEFTRTEMIIGKENLNKLKKAKVAVFGVGGVGSFVVEGLVRAGIGSIVLVDYDNICITNINRQIHATQKTIGKSKVEVMKDRILSINPKIEIKTFNKLYNEQNGTEFFKENYSYVVDAIDMVSSKLDLIERCKKIGIPIISSMGTGNKLNPTMLKVADIYETSVCPLARVMRKELRKRKIKSLKVVYSEEVPIKPIKISNENKKNDKFSERNTPGSISFVPSVAGLIIASEVVKDIIGYNEKEGKLNETNRICK